MNLWLTIIGMGVITFLIRLSFILLSDRLSTPDIVQRGLRYVPVAVLAAIIAPAMIQPDGQIDLSLSNIHLFAGLIAIAIAWRTQNIIWTVVAGMVSLWLFQYFLQV